MNRNKFACNGGRLGLNLILFLFLIIGTSCVQRPDRVVVGIALTAENHPAVQMAVNEINESGGIDGAPIEVDGLEWKVPSDFKPEDVLKWADRFAGNRELLAIVGHSDSSSTLAAAPLYNARGIPQVVTIATHPEITRIGPWSYRICISDEQQGPALAEYAVREWGKRRISIFYVNDDYGKGLTQSFEKRVEALGGEIVSSILHRNVLEKSDRSVILSVLRRLKGEQAPDLFVLFQRPDAAVWTVGRIRSEGFDADILGGDNVGLLDSGGPLWKSVEGVRMCRFFFESAGNAKTRAFAGKFLKRTGKDPNYSHAFSYDAVYLVRDAILQGGFSREGVKSHLDRLIREKSVIEGVAGSYTLGEDRNARRDIHIVEARPETAELLKTLPIR